MNFSIPTDELEDLLKTARKAMATASANPILENVRIEADRDSGRVTICATDISQYVRLSGPAQVSASGRVCVDPERVTRALRTTPADTVSMMLEETDEDDTEVVLRANGTWWELHGADPTDYPGPPDPPETYPIEVEAIALQGAVDRVSYATAEEKGRYALNGLLLEAFAGGGARLTAADGAIMARTRMAADTADAEDGDWIVPPQAFELALAGCTGNAVEMACTDSTIYLRAPGVQVSCQMVEGQFPDTDAVIPSEEGRQEVTVETDALDRAFRQAQVVTTEATRAVDWNIGGDDKSRHLFGAESSEVGSSRVELEAEYAGESRQIAFNPDYVLAICQHAVAEEITLWIDDRRSPVLIDPGDDTTVVLSPIVREEAE